MTVSVRPQEFSVVYTDRALNHMSAPFKRVMLDIGDMLKEVYHAEHAVIIPGSGTYAMEACARQFATNKKALVLRNGYFSYRWTHIFDTCEIPSEHVVIKARPVAGLFWQQPRSAVWAAPRGPAGPAARPGR